MNKIYTKTGDKGTTSLVGGVKVKKDDDRIEAYGTVDELNSYIGLLITKVADGSDKQFLEGIQNVLFVIGSYLATDQSKSVLRKSTVIDEHMVKTIENEIDNILGIIPPQKTFILPGGTEAASIAHICRTICRRAERRIYAMADSSKIDEYLLEYINRLSDYLYVFARKLNFISGEEEKIWQKTCK